MPQYDLRSRGTSPRDPAEERAAPVHGPAEGKDEGDIVLRTHLNVISADSKTGSNPCIEEPDAGIPHVRICGGLGWHRTGEPPDVTSAYPTCARKSLGEEEAMN